MAYFASLALAVAAWAQFQILPWRIGRLGVDDFARIWAGPRAFVLGLDPYDALTWVDTAIRLGTPAPDTAVYLYPPWVAVALAPFGAAPVVPATIVWLAGGIVAAVATLRALLRAVLPGVAWAHGLAGLLLLGSAPSVVTLMTGQWSFWFVAALAGIALLVRVGRPSAAGLLATAMLAKPPLFIFAAAALAVHDLWPTKPPMRPGRLVGAGLLGGVALVSLGWALLPSWWPAWLRHVAAVQLDISPIALPTLFRALIGQGGDWVAAAVLLVCVAAALRFHPRGAAWLPVWFALSITGVVYSNTYDALLLIVPLVLAAGAAPRGFRKAVPLVGGSVLLLGVMPYLHANSALIYAVIAPLLAFVLIVGSLWPVRAANARETSTRVIALGSADGRPRRQD